MSSHSPPYDLGQNRPRARIGVYLSPILAVTGVMALVTWGATEWVAWRLRFHPSLGEPVFEASSGGSVVILGAASVLALLVLLASFRVDSLRRGAVAAAALLIVAIGAAFLPMYAPWSVWVWHWQFGNAPGAKLIFDGAENAIAIPAHLLFLVAMYVGWRRARRNAGTTDAHGSARWASAEEVAATELLEGEGLFLGVFKQHARYAGVYLRHRGAQHVLGFAPTRSGKGVGWVIPTLLTWPDSVLVHDIKGENWLQTAGWRSAELGSHCLKFDPTCRDGSGARYNPLLEVRRGPEEVRDAQNIADMLVDPDGHGVKDHWDITAEEVLVGAILHVLYVGRDKTLRGCLDLLTSPHAAIEDVLSQMLSTDHDPERQMAWVDRSSGEPTRTHPVVAGAARSLLNKSENERSSVISSAVKCLSLFRDEVVAANTATSDFAIEDLVRHESPVSLYLVVPPSDVSRTRPLMRLLINQIGRRLTESLDPREGGATRRRLLLMMDEFPTLGRLDFFQTQLAYLAGYGIQAFLIVQDLSQLYAAYGTNESIISNCHVRVAFAPNKVETARLLSEMAGTMTVRKARRMYSGNRLSPWLSHVSESEEESQRPLVTPDEVLRLPEDNAIVFVAGHRPIWAMKARYFKDSRLACRAALPPPTRVEPISHPWDTWTLAAPDAEPLDRAGEHGSDSLLPEDDDELHALA